MTEFCDTIATGIARYEKYRCWASKRPWDKCPARGIGKAFLCFLLFFFARYYRNESFSKWYLPRQTKPKDWPIRASSRKPGAFSELCFLTGKKRQGEFPQICDFHENTGGGGCDFSLFKIPGKTPRIQTGANKIHACMVLCHQSCETCRSSGGTKPSSMFSG